ncbi:amidohydrolase family protein [Anaerobacillus alkaliphilus]|uniref:amidohydrolase family protein n=1 Tax=Anaerobacillus alkaliphilus TaxID=1548597 RepID=UPI00240D2509|nr:amidohydrolase family protein [Anaerobacillus alkaliphilus]
MSPMEVIQASTRVAAECLGLDDRGVFSEGKIADLLIQDENPLMNLGSLKANKIVIKNGKVVSKGVTKTNHVQDQIAMI